MKIQSNNYIPVRHLPDRPLTSEEKEITKQIIANNEEQQGIMKQIIANNEKMLSLKPIFEKGLEWLKTQQAENSKGGSLASTFNKANVAYETANKVSSAIKQIEDVETKTIDPVSQREILTQADFALNLEDYRGALTEYNKILVGRDNKPVEDNYRPSEEKLRQASKLYTYFQPLIDVLKVPDAVKLKLYCTGIAAHTLGAFSLSKAEALHMIQNQFYYPVE